MTAAHGIVKSGLSEFGERESALKLKRRIFAVSAASAAAFALAAFAPCPALASDAADASSIEGTAASQEIIVGSAQSSSESLVETLSAQIQRDTDAENEVSNLASNTGSAPVEDASKSMETPDDSYASISHDGDEVLYVADSSSASPEAYLYTYEFNSDGTGQMSSVTPLEVSGGSLTQTTGQPYVYTFSGTFTSADAPFFATNPNSVNYGRAEYSVDGNVVSAGNKYVYDGIEVVDSAGMTNPSGGGSITPVFTGNTLTGFTVNLNCSTNSQPVGTIVFQIKFAQVTAKISFNETSLDGISGTWVNRPSDRVVTGSEGNVAVTFPRCPADITAPDGYSLKGWMNIATCKDGTKTVCFYSENTYSIEPTQELLARLVAYDFYPVWEKTSSPEMYTVTFSDCAYTQPASEAGTWTDTSVAHVFTGTATSTVDLEKQKLTSDVYSFYGWAGPYTASMSAIGYQLAFGNATLVQLAALSYTLTGTFSKTVTIYPLWTVSYSSNGNGGALSSSGATTQDLIFVFPGTGKAIVDGLLRTLPTNNYTREGDTQVGWNTKADGSGKSYALYTSGSDSYAMENRLEVPDFPLSNLVLYAQWASGAYLDDAGELAGNSVTYVANGGQGDLPVAVSGERDDVVTLAANTLERPGFIANGWNTKADGTGTAYADGAEFTLAGAVSLYAAWKAKTYTLTFDVNGGTGMSSSSVSVRADQKVSLPSTKPKRSGFLFKGWFYNNGDGVYAPVTSSTSVSEIVAASKDTTGSDISIDALWGVVSNAIIYMLNGADGGNVTSAPALVDTAVRVVAENAFTRDGYVAAGWNTERDGSGTSYAGGEVVTLTDNLTLWAQWNAAESGAAPASAAAAVSGSSLDKTVRYLLNGATGGSIFDGSTGTEDGENVVLADNALTRSGYTASGWNTEPDGSGTHYSSGDIVTLSSDLVLYAQWIAGDPVNEGGDASGMAPSGYTGDPTVGGASAASESGSEGVSGALGGTGSGNGAERAYRASVGLAAAFAAALNDGMHTALQDVVTSLRASAKDAVAGALDVVGGAQGAQNASGIDMLTIVIALLAAVAILLLILAIAKSRKREEE